MPALRSFAGSIAAAAVLIAPVARAQPAPSAAPAPMPPAGTYYMDPSHTSLTFKVNHLGFSHYTARFTKLDGQMTFDPDHPEKMGVTAEIDPTSLELNTPPTGFHDQLMGDGWFNAVKFPKMTFRSTGVTLTGPHTAKVSGELSLHGVSHPVTLEVTYNGGWPVNSFDPGGGRIGFSAHGSLNRSDFGIASGIPAPGTNMGVSDAVDIAIETEFSSKRVAVK